jgi:hypothetical protein
MVTSEFTGQCHSTLGTTDAFGLDDLAAIVYATN